MGTTTKRTSGRSRVLAVLADRGARGVTSSEVASIARLDPNTASARLATLKGEGVAVRTADKRRGRSVYVLAEHVDATVPTTARRRVADLPSMRRRVEIVADRARVLDALDDIRLALDYGRVALDALDVLLDGERKGRA